MKVKIHRVVLSVLDFEGISKQELVTLLEQTKFLYPTVHQVETNDVCNRNEWNDDHPLNKNSKNLDEFDAKFHALDKKL